MAASLEFFIEPKLKSTSMQMITQITKKATSKFQKFNEKINNTENRLGKVIKKSNIYKSSIRKLINEKIALIKKNNEENNSNKKLGVSIGGIIKKIALIGGTYIGISQIMSGINLAAEVDETNSKLEAVFGDMTGNVRKTMKDITKELNVGEVSMTKEFANIGAIFRGLGFEGDSLVDNTQSLLTAALDASSFHNMDFQRSIGAIRGAMLGESEALKGATGIIVQEDTMGQYATSVGSVWKNLNVAQKAQLRFNYIMEQLKKQGATGDLKRTKDSFVNVQRAINELTTDVKAGFFATLKDSLLPGMVKLRDYLINNKDSIIEFGKNATNTFINIINAMSPFINIIVWVTKLLWDYRDVIIMTGSAILGYKTYMGALSLATKTYTGLQWLLNAALTANPIGLVVAGIAALAAGFVLAYKNIEPFRNFINDLWDKLANSGFGKIIGKLFGGGNATVDINNNSLAAQSKINENSIKGSTVNTFNTQNSKGGNTNISQPITINGGIDSQGLEKKIKRTVDEHNRQQLAGLGGY